MIRDKVIGIYLGGTHLRVALLKGNKILEYIKKQLTMQLEMELMDKYGIE